MQVSFNSFYCDVLEPIHVLKNGEPFTLEVNESEFFDYEIQTRFTDLENSFLLFECSQKHHTELYISNLDLYPYENEHKWAFGDLPEAVLEKAKSNPFMRDLFTEANPFLITKEGEIVYERKFRNPEQYTPKYAHQELPDLMRRLTTYGATESDSQDNGIRVIIESESWRFISHHAHIGIHNKSGKPEEYKVKITELKTHEMLPHDIRERYQIFDSIFKR